LLNIFVKIQYLNLTKSNSRFANNVLKDVSTKPRKVDFLSPCPHWNGQTLLTADVFYDGQLLTENRRHIKPLV